MAGKQQEQERRAVAARYHAEYREKAQSAPEVTARWILAAAAGGALSCFNGLIDPDLPAALAGTVAAGLTGFILSMSLTGAGLSYRNRADTEDMIFWSKLDRELADIPLKCDTDCHIRKARRFRTIGGWLLSSGNLAFMFTAIWGGWALNSAIK